MNGHQPAGTSGSCPSAGDICVISSYVEAKAILVSPAARVPTDSPPLRQVNGGAAAVIIERGVYLRELWMWGCDTDRRPVVRKVGALALGSASIEPLFPYLESRAFELLDTGSQASEIDLVASFARTLVRDALMELFGIGEAARAALDAQVGGMSGFIPGHGGGGTARYFALAATAKIIEDVWRQPLPPLAAASKVLRAAVEAGELSRDEALAQATLLLFGNSYTTLDALTGLLARLAERPDLWQAARSGALTVSHLVEEGLRLGPPAHLVLLRDAVDEIAFPGGAIPAGTRIVLPLDQLNRDATCFANGDAFEPGRSGPPHLAFGAGRHMCIGLHLARAVIRTAVESLLGCLPEWPPETQVSRAPGILGGPTITKMTVPSEAVRSC